MRREMILGIDVGTSSVKCVLLDRFGQVVDSASHPLTTMYTASGFAEQDPDTWFTAVTSAARQLALEPEKDQVVAVGACGAAHIPVLLDHYMQPIRPAIMWTDQRSAAQVERLSSRYGADLLATCYNRPSCTWTLPQLMWLQENEPDIYGRVCHLLLGKDYLVYRLTGVLATDEGNAASTLMLDMQRKQWATEYTALTGLPVDVLPPILASHQIAGRLLEAPARQLGLPAGIPVITGALDSVMEMLALGIFANGQAMLRLGTAGGIMVVSTVARPSVEVITYPFPFDQGWCCQAFNNSCASAVNWMHDLLGIGMNSPGSYRDFDRLADSAPAGSDGLIFHPYLLGERAPLWDPLLQASFVGAGMQHGRTHFARAVLEGVGFAIRECRDSLLHIGYEINSLRLAGGGARSSVWRQIVSDILGMPLMRSGADESAVGAALLAAVSVGVFADIGEAAIATARTQEVTEPRSRNRAVYDEAYRGYQEIRHRLQPYYHNEA